LIALTKMHVLFIINVRKNSEYQNSEIKMNEYITANNLDQEVDFETHQMEILLRTVDIV